MKRLIAFFILMTLASPLFATRTYHPHIERIEVAFESGDRVIFTTHLNTVALTAITVVSREDIEYQVPSSAVEGIVAPRLDSLRITFHENSTQPYTEGRFSLTFTYGEGAGEEARFFFENGTFVGGLEEWLAYEHNK
ncbi:hypothetical protein [Actomonas aquatica]|uniref:DUF4426 domain-containing protein n=1 Tax=Actomonas aquatica TaxID=2866162 RepID=A0ABZ1CAV5_9BACT|nr:hypothetical protein [Opitutus sp. WL0086]WRQ88829.1 hypothetical protein K1X11_005390 [Opitutus sp. WL0086]